MSNSQPNRPGGYLIRLKANPDLVLAAVNGKAVVVWRNIDDWSQLWGIAPVSSGSTTYRISNLIKGELSVQGFGDNLVFGVEGKGWNIPDGRESTALQAIRVANNHDWNLNALGNGPYDVGNPVGVWDWTRGAGNEMWQLSWMPDNPPTTQWKYFANGGHCLAVQEGDTAGTQSLICDGKTDFPQLNDRLVFAKIEWTQGFALRNKYNGKYIFWKGPNQPLGQSEKMTVRSLWTWSNRRETWGNIRPALDASQNFNVIGAPKDTQGATVGTWSWGGGRSEETWSMIDAYPK